MKKKIFLVALVLILTSVTALAVWQWDNIVAVVDGIRYDDEQIAQKAAMSVQKVDQYFEDNHLNKVTPMTPEQEEALQNGEITSEDAVKIMTGQLTLEEAKEANAVKENNSATDGITDEKHDDTDKEYKSDSNEESADKSGVNAKEDNTDIKSDSTAGSDDNSKKSESDSSVKSENEYNSPEPDKKPEEIKEKPDKKQPETVAKPDAVSDEYNKNTTVNSSDNGDTGKTESVSPSGGSDVDSIISSKVAELYVIKSNFYSQFNSRYSQVRNEFHKRPVSEQTRAHVAAVVRSYMSEGLAMERECDAQVEAILSELSGLLSRAGRDQSLVDSIRSAYNSEKSALKSRLVNKYF